MKKLDIINSAVVKPQTFASLDALLPLFSGIFFVPLALGAAPQISFTDNVLAVFSAALSLTSIALILIPHIFKWDWRAKFFDVSLLYVGTVGSLGVTPWLGIVLYSALPIEEKFLILTVYASSIILWCCRFVTYYRCVHSDPNLLQQVHQEESDAIYYFQAGDKFLIEKKFKVQQVPSGWAFISFMALASLTIPFATNITTALRIPFIHVFVSICMVPIVMMCVGLGVRGYLVYYHYPWKLKRETGKEVFVVIATG